MAPSSVDNNNYEAYIDSSSSSASSTDFENYLRLLRPAPSPYPPPRFELNQHIADSDGQLHRVSIPSSDRQSPSPSNGAGPSRHRRSSKNSSNATQSSTNRQPLIRPQTTTTPSSFGSFPIMPGRFSYGSGVDSFRRDDPKNPQPPGTAEYNGRVPGQANYYYEKISNSKDGTFENRYYYPEERDPNYEESE